MRRVIEAAILRYAISCFGSGTGVEIAPATPLEGGASRASLAALDVVATNAAGALSRFRVVQKHTGPVELRAMRALAALPDRTGLVRSIGEGTDERGPWIAVPFHPGDTPTFDTTPGPVFETLARVHAHFLAGTADAPLLEGIPPIDAAWCHSNCEEMLALLVQRQREKPELDAAIRALEATVRDERIDAALTLLPRTLVHGDMHPGNVILAEDGPVIIDWGNARLGPAMLDLANLVSFDSENYARYLRARERASAPESDLRLAEIGYAWATAQVNTQYLGFAAVHSPTHVDRMVGLRTRALQRIGELLDRPGTTKPVS